MVNASDLKSDEQKMFLSVRSRSGVQINRNNMRIAAIDVPKGCDKIFVDLENGMLTVSYGSTTNKREVFNQYTRHIEELPGIGDLCIMWNDEDRHEAIIGTLEQMAGVLYIGNNSYEYKNAVKFRDHQQYLDIRGIYGED